MVDGPSPFDTMATWKHHLAWLRTLPKDTMLLPEMIADAEEMLARKSKEAGV